LTPTRRDQLLGELVDIIKARAMWGVAIAATVQDIQDTLDAHPALKRVVSSPYTFCVAHCAAAIGQRVAQHCPAETTAFYFFERGHANQGEVLDFLNRVDRTPILARQYRYEGAIFLKKEEARPLEAADLLAWEWCEFYTESYYATGRPMRGPLRSLLEKPHGTLFLNRENVEEQALHLIRSGFVEEKNS
jgi:hypothetical protein